MSFFPNFIKKTAFTAFIPAKPCASRLYLMHFSDRNCSQSAFFFLIRIKAPISGTSSTLIRQILAARSPAGLKHASFNTAGSLRSARTKGEGWRRGYGFPRFARNDKTEARIAGKKGKFRKIPEFKVKRNAVIYIFSFPFFPDAFREEKKTAYA